MIRVLRSSGAGLDRLTGRTTMYRLMIIVLSALTGITFVLSFIPGGLSFAPLQLAVSLVTLLAATYLSNRLFALIFRVRPHGESSIITGLLLFFLFWPYRQPSDLLVYVAVATLASGSKYLFAFRGRHIFNPVAIGSLLIAITQLSAAVWWVATPYLFIPVAVGGFLVVWRTRRFALVGVFIAVALVLTLVRFSLQGLDLPQALSFALLSAPLAFFALFMLDEPLTQPPLRWQQLVFAALVGVLYSVPFSIGPFYTSPELALVVGNLLAFAFGQRASVKLTFAGSRELTPSTREFIFTPARPVAFRPGQYVELSVPHRRMDARGSRRHFTVVTSPASGEIGFGLRLASRSSSFKAAINELKPGTRVHVTSVGGDFVLPRNSSTPLLLVAGGIGITPFISMLRHQMQASTAPGSTARDIVVVYAVSDSAELPYRAELEASGVPVLIVAPTAPATLPTGWVYLGSGRLDASLLADRVPGLSARTAYISGPPGMVTALRQQLRKLGIRRVKTDYFSGY